MKLQDLTHYNQALLNATQFELENIAKVSEEYRERFLKFMRYVKLLSEENPLRIEGQKSIKMVYELEQFKGYQNQTLNILDNESMIQ